jgi:hypothetical protein
MTDENRIIFSPYRTYVLPRSQATDRYVTTTHLYLNHCSVTQSGMLYSWVVTCTTTDSLACLDSILGAHYYQCCSMTRGDSNLASYKLDTLKSADLRFVETPADL